MSDRRKIVLTNDDGIDAEGLRVLAAAAMELGDVYIVAPSKQCSAMSHRITIRQKMELKKCDYPLEVKAAYSLDGMPPDCVKIAIYHLMKEEKPNLIISGVNHGYNIAFDTCYSGTVAAALEGIMNHVPSIAVSNGADDWKLVSEKLTEILKKVLSEDIAENEIWNINFPKCGKDGFKGIKYDVIPASMQVFEQDITEYMEDGTIYVSEEGPMIDLDHYPEGTDMEAVFAGYISIGKLKSQVIF